MTTYDFTVTNYQIIKQAHLQFHPGLTLITGKSNNGKSSIFKAFQQLVYNTPGTHFIRHNTPNTQLTLIHGLQHPEGITKHYEITYTKSPDGGKYDVYNGLNNKQEQYTKLGSSQLPQIKDLTNINKELNYNFWNQMDKPFLISLSPKEQFDLIQNSPHSTPLNNCITSLTHDRKQTQQSQLQRQSQLELLQQQNDTYNTQLQNLPTITTLHDKLNSLLPTHTQLQQLIQLLTQHNSVNLTPIHNRLTQLQNIPQIQSNTLTTLQQIKQVYSQLLRTVKPINDLHSQQNSLTQQLNVITQIQQTHFQVCPFCNRPMQNDHQNHN